MKWLLIPLSDASNHCKFDDSCNILLDNEAIELEFISVLIYYTYMRKLEKEESMMCRNDKGRVDPKWKTPVSYTHLTLPTTPYV